MTEASPTASPTATQQPRTSPLGWPNFGSRMETMDWWLLAALLSLSPMLASQCVALFYKPHYQFFPIAVLAAIFFMIRRGETTAKRPMSIWRWRVASGLALGGAATGLLSAAIFAPWLAYLSALLLVSGWALTRWRGSPWYRVCAWLSILWITLPLPMGLDERLIRRLQLLSMSSASTILDAIGVPHLPLGNSISLGAGRLFIDQVCFGMDSPYALLAVALLIVVARRTALVPALFTLASVPAWAWLGNTLRLVLVAVLLDQFGMDFAHGWKHSLLGLVLFLVMCLFLVATFKAVESLLRPFPVRTVTSGPWHTFFNTIVCWPGRDPARPNPRVSPSSPASTTDSGQQPPFPNLRYGTYGALGFSIATLVVGMMAYTRGPARIETFADIRIDAIQVNRAFSPSDLPDDFGGMQLTAFEKIHRPMSKLFYGEHSVVWQYADGDATVQISLDFPFPGFHALEVCYVGSGCEMLGPRKSIDMSAGDDQRTSGPRWIEEVQLADQLHGETYLWYAEFDRQGRDVWRLGNRYTGSLPARIAHALRIQPATYQVQLYVHGTGKLMNAQKDRYRQLLLEASRNLLPKLQQLETSDE